MRNRYFKVSKKAICLYSILFLWCIQLTSAQEFCIQSGSDQIAGTQDGYRYELWNQNSQGTACMTLGDGATFSGQWNGILNYLSRRGLGYDQTKEHQEYGTFSTTYNCNYNPVVVPGGNSYLSVYGWTVEPLIEFYIVEDWRQWIPSMAAGAELIDTFTVDGSEYEIYENTRVNQPSILGTATFQQYFSIRKDTRNSGSIDISAHFNKWESLGRDLGKLHEVSFVVEGYQSNGSFEFTELKVVADDTSLSVDDFSTKQFFNIYPNPTNGNATIQLNKTGIETNILVYDALGKVIFNQKNVRDDAVKVSNLKSGMYFVLVDTGNQNFTSKLLVY